MISWLASGSAQALSKVKMPSPVLIPLCEVACATDLLV